MICRRTLVATMGLNIASGFSLSGMAQVGTASRKSFRLAIITNSIAPRAGFWTQWAATEAVRRGLVDELARLGFSEGTNLDLVIETPREGDLGQVARRLVSSAPDAIIAFASDAVIALRNETRSIPIVMFADDPVEHGFAVTTAKPGGNTTGIASFASDLDAKRLQILREAVPDAQTFAVLMSRIVSDRRQTEQSLRRAASSLGIELTFYSVASHAEYRATFEAMRAAGIQALLIAADNMLARDGEVLSALSKESGFPTVCEWPEMARSSIVDRQDSRLLATCMIGYGPHRQQLMGRLANYVARIFRGASPADLPIERPTRFELVVNLQAARALGLSLPLSILVRADEVIE